MPRKRSASGRSRRSTITSNIYLQTEKINKKIQSLERGRNFGKYKSKELIRFAKNNEFVDLRKARGSRRRRLRVKNLREATFGQLALISKKLKEIVRSKAFTNIGIKNIREETRKKVTDTLKGIVGPDLTDKDVDLFYDIIKYKTDDIINKIGPSEFYTLVMEAREDNMGQEEWLEMISNYVTINNESIRKAGEYLYNKYVR